MKKTFAILFAFLTVSLASFAQAIERHKIAIFTPLYLDSAFDATGNFRYNEKNYARFVNAGLDFYYGAQLALDSLQKRGAPLEVFVYDNRSREPITDQMNSPEMEDVELIIGQTNAQETRFLADRAFDKKIPFVSATFPNDAGITNNPYFVILNSSLQAHADGLYRFLQKYHSLDHITYFRKTGQQEDQLKSYFTELEKTTASVPLKINFVDLPVNFTTQTITASLDTTRKNVCIAGSLDENFAMKLTQSLNSVSTSLPIRVFGMATWENFNFSKTQNIEVIYSTPFYYNRQTPLEIRLANEYTAKMAAKPGDMFFRGYETVLRFGLLLLDTKKEIASSLSRKGNTIFTPFNIQPAFKDRTVMTLDYFENKNLYFVKQFAGMKTVVY